MRRRPETPFTPLSQGWYPTSTQLNIKTWWLQVSAAGLHYLVNYGFILIFDPYVHLGHEKQKQWPIFNVKYSVSGILSNVCAQVSGQHQPFLYSNYLTLIIGACHLHLCSRWNQMLGGWGGTASSLNSRPLWCDCPKLRHSSKHILSRSQAPSGKTLAQQARLVSHCREPWKTGNIPCDSLQFKPRRVVSSGIRCTRSLLSWWWSWPLYNTCVQLAHCEEACVWGGLTLLKARGAPPQWDLLRVCVCLSVCSIHQTLVS